MNNSTNSTTSMKYVYITFDNVVLLTSVSVFILLIIYIVLANGFILHFMIKIQKEINRIPYPRAFQRKLTKTFIQSLAWSNLLGGTVNFLILCGVFFTNETLTKNIVICRGTKFLINFFSLLIFYNLFVIGMERYLATFHPFKLPSDRAVKGLVIGSWVSAALVALLPTQTFRLLKVEDKETPTYTIQCLYYGSSQVYKAIFSVYIIFNYIILTTALSITNILVFRYVRKRASRLNLGANSWRFQGTNTFIGLTFCYIIPYFIFVVSLGVKKHLKIQLSIPAEIVLNSYNILLVFANSVISPTVLLLCMPRLRRMLCRFARSLAVCFRTNDIASLSYSKEEGTVDVKIISLSVRIQNSSCIAGSEQKHRNRSKTSDVKDSHEADSKRM